MKFPPRHPFNPLAADRLLSGAHDGQGATLDEVREAFSFVFGEGNLVDSEEGVLALAERLGLDPALANAPASKDILKANTQAAIDSGVFGVPSFVPVGPGGEKGPVFWGVDGMNLLRDWLDDPSLFEKEPYSDLASVQIGIRRERQ